ncbi:hypothetical protein HU200_054870 [Digitaria exilis]|uniref:Transposase (putative) gypsy type domain-containing protein n=1 Tax=Digitaria exilis TaxID=1010633 RepID=A0A835E6N5_9POAL|nr:hypothetical protein HU200_054870 [Digitaria exilis]
MAKSFQTDPAQPAPQMEDDVQGDPVWVCLSDDEDVSGPASPTADVEGNPDGTADEGDKVYDDEKDDEEEPKVEMITSITELGAFPLLLEDVLEALGNYTRPLYITTYSSAANYQEYYHTQVHVRAQMENASRFRTWSIHESSLLHTSYEAAISDAARRAVPSISHQFQRELSRTEYRHLPRRHPGTEQTVVVGGGPTADPRLNVLARVTAALNTDMEGVINELAEAQERIAELEEQLAEQQGQGDDDERMANAWSPPRKKLRYGAPFSFPFSFSRPNSLALPRPSSFSAHRSLLLSFLSLTCGPAVSVSSSPSRVRAGLRRVHGDPVSTSFPWRSSWGFLGLYKPPPELSFPSTQASSFRVALVAIAAANPRVKPPPRFEPSRSPSPLPSRNEAAELFFPLSLALPSSHGVAVVTEPPLVAESSHPRDSPISGKAPPRAAVSGSQRRRAVRLRSDENGPFEGDQDQVYEEEPPQYFEQGKSEDFLVVWDPITDDRRELPLPPRFTFTWTTAVLCAATGDCDHLDCHRGGPFVVVFLGSGGTSSPFIAQGEDGFTTSFYLITLVGLTLPTCAADDPFLGCHVSFTFPSAASRAAARMQLPFPNRSAADQLYQMAGGQVMSGVGREKDVCPTASKSQGSGMTDMPDSRPSLIDRRVGGRARRNCLTPCSPEPSAGRATLTVGPYSMTPTVAPDLAEESPSSHGGRIFKGSFFFIPCLSTMTPGIFKDVTWTPAHQITGGPTLFAKGQAEGSCSVPLAAKFLPFCLQRLATHAPHELAHIPFVLPGPVAGIRLGPRIMAAYLAAPDLTSRSWWARHGVRAWRWVNALIRRLVPRKHVGAEGARSCAPSMRPPATPPPIYKGTTAYRSTLLVPRCRFHLFASLAPRLLRNTNPCASSPLKPAIVDMATRGSSSSAQLRPWARSSASVPALESLVSRGLLCPRTSDEEWISPPLSHKTPSPPAGYVVSFMAYHVRGFAMPAHRFLHEVLHHFGVELHALAPNGVQQMANFVALCEGYLGIDLDFHHFLLFFKAALVRPHGILAPEAVPRGHFPRSELRGSIEGWNKGWFYLKNHAGAALPPFDPTSTPSTKDLAYWQYGPEAADRKKLKLHLECLAKLRSCSLTGIGIAEAFHRRRVAPLMARRLRHFEMHPTTTKAELRPNLVSRVFPSEDEIRARLAELVDSSRAASMSIPTPGQPPMLPRPGAMDLSHEASGGLPRKNREADRKRKRDDTARRLRTQERRRERERKERLGEEVGSDLASSCDEEENLGGHSPLLGDCTMEAFVAHGELPTVPIVVEELPSPPPSAPPAMASRTRSSSRPMQLEQVCLRPSYCSALSVSVEARHPHKGRPRKLGRPTQVRPGPKDWPHLPPLRRGAFPDDRHPASAGPFPPVVQAAGTGVTYVLATSPVAGEAADTAEQATDVGASAVAVAGDEPGAGAMVCALEPFPTAGAPAEGATMGPSGEAPLASPVAPPASEPPAANPRDGVEASRWSMKDLFGEAEARARSESEPPAASSAFTLVSVLAPPSSASLAEPCPRRTSPWKRRTRRSTVCSRPFLLARSTFHTAALKSRVADGITHRTTLLSRFGMLRDAAGAVLSRLGFPLSEDIERLPGDLHRAAECCGELRAVAEPMSGDPARLPAELDQVPARVGALAKQSLVRGVQEAFTLVRSHYDGIHFDRMAAGFPIDFTSEALDAMAEEVKVPAERFANGLVPTTDAEGNPMDGADPDQAL